MNSVRSKKNPYNFYTVNLAFFLCSFDRMCLLTSYTLAVEMFTSHAHTAHKHLDRRLLITQSPHWKQYEITARNDAIMILSPNFDACVVHNMHIVTYNAYYYYEYYSEFHSCIIHHSCMLGCNCQIREDGFQQMPFWYWAHGDREW